MTVAAMLLKTNPVSNNELFWMATVFLALMFLLLLVIWWGLRKWLRSDTDDR